MWLHAQVSFALILPAFMYKSILSTKKKKSPGERGIPIRGTQPALYTAGGQQSQTGGYRFSMVRGSQHGAAFCH